MYHGIIVPTWGLFVGDFCGGIVWFAWVFFTYLILSKAVSDFKALFPY